MEELNPIANEPLSGRYFRVGSRLAKAHPIGREMGP